METGHVALDGFEARFVDFPDYILRITEDIWEGRNIDAIRRYYAGDCHVHTGLGTSVGVDAVIQGTLEKSSQFPDRQILGEAVIWSGSTAVGLLSSHRSMMLQTHGGEGSLGAPTGRRLHFRAIADCAARDNQIYEEWLVVDQSAAVLQAGLDPVAVARTWASDDDRRGLPHPPLAFAETRSGPDTRVLSEDPAAILVRDIHHAVWGRQDLSPIARHYDRAVNLHLPGGLDAYGTESLGRFALGYLASFPNAAFSIDHSIALRRPDDTTKVSTRWTMTGTHAGHGRFGAPTGAPMLVLGITHTELRGDTILREWVVIDEMSILRRIARKAG